MNRIKTIKQLVWSPLEPMFPFWRWVWIKMGWAVVPNGRQNFYIAHLKPEISHDDFKKHLKKLITTQLI